jgi:hypothetical protein
MRPLHLYHGMLAVCAVSLLAASSVQAVTFKLKGQLDTAALTAGVPGSVAAYGNDVYIGNLFSAGQLHHIVDPITAPTRISTFGGLNDPATNGGLASAGLTTNGYTNLNTNGTTLVASTSNGGDTPDIIQAYTVGTNTLNWGSNAANLDIGGAGFTGQSGGLIRIDGAAVDPVSGNVMAVSYGAAEQYLINPTTGAPLYPDFGITPTYFVVEPILNEKTGWKDIDFDNTTGDIVTIAATGVSRGLRRPVPPNDYDYRKVTTDTAGLQRLVPFSPVEDVAALNVEFLPAAFAGQNLVIFNLRSAANTFADQVKVYDANLVNTPVTTNFVLQDGVTPFTTGDATTGIYDFSYDPVNKLLYIADQSSSQVHIFEVATAAPLLVGDYNQNNVVDAADYTNYRDAAGTNTVLPNDPLGGTIGAGQYNQWKNNFGATAPAVAAGATVPEPATIALLLLSCGSVLSRIRRTR